MSKNSVREKHASNCKTTLSLRKRFHTNNKFDTHIAASAQMIFKQLIYDSEDYRKTLELRESVLRIPIGRKLSNQDTLGEDSQLHFGIFMDSEVVACVVVRPADTIKAVRLRQMAVAAALQGQSIGNQLLCAVEKRLKEQGCQLIQLNARRTAIGFYEKRGYQTTGADFIEIGIPHIKMQKSI